MCERDIELFELVGLGHSRGELALQRTDARFVFGIFLGLRCDSARELGVAFGGVGHRPAVSGVRCGALALALAQALLEVDALLLQLTRQQVIVLHQNLQPKNQAQ